MLEQGPTEKAIIEMCYREGMPLPQSIQNAPELYIGLQLYYQAFLDLSSCRGTGYSTEGPIPWLAIRDWAREHGLSDEQTGDLYHFIPSMDETYLKHKAEKLKATLPKQNGK